MHTRHVTIGGPDTGNMRLTMAILDGVARRHDKARQREARRARVAAWVRSQIRAIRNTR